MPKKLSAFTVLLFAAAFSFAATVNIYHTSDTHGFYFPRDKDGKNTGGFAALAALIEKDGAPHLLLDSGDFTSGTAEAKQSRGMLSIKFMNVLKYNAAALGNHEADFGQQSMADNINAAAFDILAANLTKCSHPVCDKIKPFKIYDIEDIKIAVIGIARSTSDSPDIKAGNVKTSLKNALEEIKKQGANAVVVIIHESVEDETPAVRSIFETLAQSADIDLVLGGHVHRIVQNRKINNVTFVESGHHLNGVSKVALTFNDYNAKLESIKSQYITLDTDTTGEDMLVKKFAEANYDKTMDEVLATANATLFQKSKNPEHLDSPLANMFTDAVRNATKADIALHNTGALRMDIKKGPVTRRVLFDVYPFDNTIVILKVEGRLIKKLLLNSLRHDRSTMQYSGLEVKYRFKNKKPELIRVLVNGAPLEDDKIYTLATNSFLASGAGEGYLFKNLEDKQPFGTPPVKDGAVFENYLKSFPAGFDAPKTGRIQKIK